MQSLGERLAQARRQLSVRTRADVSPSDVAVALDVAPATVYRWESDEKSPSEENLMKLAAFLGVTPAYLRYGVQAIASPEIEENASDFVARMNAKKTAPKTGGRRKPRGG